MDHPSSLAFQGTDSGCPSKTRVQSEETPHAEHSHSLGLDR